MKILIMLVLVSLSLHTQAQTNQQSPIIQGPNSLSIRPPTVAVNAVQPTSESTVIFIDYQDFAKLVKASEKIAQRHAAGLAEELNSPGAAGFSAATMAQQRAILENMQSPQEMLKQLIIDCNKTPKVIAREPNMSLDATDSVSTPKNVQEDVIALVIDKTNGMQACILKPEDCAGLVELKPRLVKINGTDDADALVKECYNSI